MQKSRFFGLFCCFSLGFARNRKRGFTSEIIFNIISVVDSTVCEVFCLYIKSLYLNEFVGF
nr:MAG TPA: hypothetical protein [Caudoviricetes sp.]